MKISINRNHEITETEIVISCCEITPEIESIMATLRILDKKITGSKNGELYILDVANIMYIEAVDRKTFIYTLDDCFETKLKLYEIEQQLCKYGFMRISKSCLVNIRYIRSLKREFNHKLLITFENNEKIIVSRQYTDELKKRLGVK